MTVPVDRFDYPLPPEAIAQTPLKQRDAARMLVDVGPARPATDLLVSDLPSLLREGDVVVLNDTRVLPARLLGTKPSGGQVEVMLLEREPTGTWKALVKPSRRVTPGTMVRVDEIRIEVGDDLGEGLRRVRLEDEPTSPLRCWQSIGFGQVPLPPYIRETLEDPDDYQTVYARRPTSVAAPTAGLHLTEGLLDRCRRAGAEIVVTELAVGLGTFRPITVEDVSAHVMHAESYEVSPEAWTAIEMAKAQGGRVIAVGTTVVRALESVALSGQLSGSTEIYIHGDYQFRLVDCLMTNFHVPRSSLLVMIDALIGERWRRMYEQALAESYRFLSFGDCCFLDRSFGRTE